MWFDSHGDLCSIPVDNFASKLNIHSARRLMLSGALDVFPVRSDSGLLALANNPRFIAANHSADGKTWSGWNEFYRSRALWARDGLGSPCLFTDFSTNKQHLYFGGIVMKNAREYKSITIGVAHRKNGKYQASR
jgi:hypothetical protein